MHSYILCISLCICLYFDPKYMQICTLAFCAYLYVSVCIWILHTCRCTLLFLNICAYALTHSVHIRMYLFVFWSCKQAHMHLCIKSIFLCWGGGCAGSARATPAPEPSLGFASHVKLERLIACLLQTFEGYCVLAIAKAGNPAVVGPEVRGEKVRKSAS